LNIGSTSDTADGISFVIFAACDVGPVAHEPTLLETLGPHVHATAVEVQDTDLSRSSVDEREQVSGEWIFVHDMLGQRVETIERDGGCPYRNAPTWPSGKNISAS
jgi:hypothetical protein